MTEKDSMEELQVQESIDYQGMKAISLRNEYLSLVVIPELGAKIASLMHRPSQTEWLWTNPNLVLKKPEYGDSYTGQHDTGGVDECFPTIAPVQFPTEPWTDITIPDHGELWSQSWDVESVESTPERVVISVSCYGVHLPYRFERTITLLAGENEVHLGYKVTNLSSFALPFLWSIHPLLRIEPGMRLYLPENVQRIRIDSSTDDFLGELGTSHPWPVVHDNEGNELDLSKVPSSDIARAVKFFAAPLNEDVPVETMLVDPKSKRGLGFRFSPNQITHIGVWMNYGGWAGVEGAAPYYNLGLEPCIVGADSLEVAVKHWREAAILQPEQTRIWSLELFLT
ncbi:MAG: hypothetical protein ABFQ89_02435 [Chloroflexota bacterium]